MEKGARIGLLKALLLLLEQESGPSGKDLLPELERQERAEALVAVLAAVKDANSIEDLRKLLLLRQEGAV
jgi:hypothetical protein